MNTCTHNPHTMHACMHACTHTQTHTESYKVKYTHTYIYIYKYTKKASCRALSLHAEPLASTSFPSQAFQICFVRLIEPYSQACLVNVTPDPSVHITTLMYYHSYAHQYQLNYVLIINVIHYVCSSMYASCYINRLITINHVHNYIVTWSM